MNKKEYLAELESLKDSIFTTSIQKEKYGTDIAWIGNPFDEVSKIKIVKFLAVENFPLKIFFKVGNIIREVEPMMREYVIKVDPTQEKINLITNFSEIVVNYSENDNHNIVTSAFLDGFYVTNYNKVLDTTLKLNSENELPNSSHEAIVYRNVEELEKILDYLLEHKELRKQINENLKHKVRNNFKVIKILLGE